MSDLFQISIKDFKETIAASVNVSASNQRLIYQGRVLQDDFCLTRGEAKQEIFFVILNAYIWLKLFFAEHDGKVLHLVQRMPVVTTSGPSATNNTTPVTNSSANPSTSGNFNPSQLVGLSLINLNLFGSQVVLKCYLFSFLHTWTDILLILAQKSAIHLLIVCKLCFLFQ